MAEDVTKKEDSGLAGMISISAEELTRLKEIEIQIKEMVPKAELEKAEGENKSLQTKIQQLEVDNQALSNTNPGDPVELGKEFAILLLKAKELDVNFALDNFTNAKDIRFGFLDAVKEKFGAEFKIDRNGDFQTQLFNLEQLAKFTKLGIQRQQLEARQSSSNSEIIDATPAGQALSGGLK